MRTDPFASLSGQVAIITGSTSGIGLGLAEVLAARGVHLVLNGLGDRAEIEKTRLGLQVRYGVKVLYHDANMLKADEIEALIAYAKTELGGLDILVNNAGIQHVEAIDSFPVADWDRIIGINLSSVFHTTRAALPIMKAKGRGRIVNIASAHGLVASPFKGAYVAAKHGVLGLTKTVALEVAKAGITVNAICPGYVKTPLVEAQIKDQARTRGISEQDVIENVMLAAMPTKQFVTYDQLGGLMLYLVSDQGASTTGAALTVDGGWTAQ